ncbi:MAG TPA: hypothetical protein VGE01_10115 [Fimbriimonas sp.]
MLRRIIESFTKPRAVAPKAVFALHDADRVVGNIAWQTVECASGDELSAGDRAIRLGEVAVELHDSKNGPLLSRKISVDEMFVLSHAVGLVGEREKLLGFGLSLGRREEQVFGWDWFNVVDSDHATKLQETGELTIRIALTDRGWDVVRTDFLTDVSLRAVRMMMPLAFEPAWRVVVRRGSWMEWPGLTSDGRVQGA